MTTSYLIYSRKDPTVNQEFDSFLEEHGPVVSLDELTTRMMKRFSCQPFFTAELDEREMVRSTTDSDARCVHSYPITNSTIDAHNHYYWKRRDEGITPTTERTRIRRG